MPITNTCCWASFELIWHLKWLWINQGSQKFDNTLVHTDAPINAITSYQEYFKEIIQVQLST